MDGRRLFGAARDTDSCRLLRPVRVSAVLVFEKEGRDPLGECTASAPAFHVDVEAEGVAFHCAAVCHEHM